MAAEAQAVCESGIDSGISVALNTVVKIALGVGIRKTDGRGNDGRKER